MSNRNSFHVIGLAGHAGVGKTTFALALAAEATRRGAAVAIVSFADALRYELRSNYSIPEYQLAKAYDKNEPCKPLTNASRFEIGLARERAFTLTGKDGDAPRGRVTVRELLQSIGQLGRAQDPEHWTKQWRETVERLRQPLSWAEHTIVVCDNVRYQNEVDAVGVLGGDTYLLKRMNAVKASSGHESDEQKLERLHMTESLDNPRLASDMLDWYMS